ncbi:MAG: aminoacyl-tRNA hydrolase [Chitinivibrionales bacterium]|nr:aminoacyl-tRNA hydrolase [Chitinivibrionales bacterium]
MIPVTNNLFIDERDISFSFMLAHGPGGQHVNKAATAVQLRYNPHGHEPLPEPVRQRLRTLAGSRMTAEGMVVISARRFRSQERNRRDAVERLTELIRSAARRERPRKATRPTAASRERRLQTKRRRSEAKRMRGPVASDE